MNITYLSGANIIFIIAIVALGVSSIFQDLKYRKIKNILLLRFLLIGASLILITFVYSLLGNSPILRGRDFRAIIAANFLAVLIGFFGWKLKMWSAADAKLFILYVFLLPPACYGTNSFFAAFLNIINFLINTLLIFFIYLAIESTIGIINFGFDILSGRHKLTRNGKPKRAKSKKILNAIKVILGYICIILFIQASRYYLTSFTHVSSLQIILYIGLILCNRIFIKMLKRFGWPLLLFMAVIIVILIINKPLLNIYFMRGVIKGLSFIAALSLIQFIANYYYEKKEKITIKTEELKPKMILAETTLFQLEDYLFSQKTILYPEGLTDEQVEGFKKILKGKNIDTVECYKGFVSAPFLFLGIIATLILKTNIWSFLF